MPYDTMQYSTVQRKVCIAHGNTTKYNIKPCNATESKSTPCNTK